MISLSLGCSSANEGDLPREDLSSIKSSVTEVDAFAKERLGIGLKALSLLLSTGRSDLLLVESLEENGQMDAVEVLEKNGYVITRRINTPQGEFVELRKTEKGMLVK